MSIVLLSAVIVGYLAWCALMIFPLWRIFARAGLLPWYSLLFAVPLAGPLIVLGLLAFLDWPAARER